LRAGGGVGLLLALALAALTLRPQLVGLGPLLPDVTDDLGVSHAVAGLLATIPVLCMGLFAPPAATLAARIGARRAVAVAVGLIGAFGLMRAGVSPAWAVIVLTVPVGIGMGLGNALMVVAVKERFADHPLLVTSIYVVGIQLGSTLSAATAVPFADATGGWRWSLAAFSVAALVSLVAWAALARGAGARPTGAAARPPRLPWRSGIAWLLAAIYLVTTIIYYGLNSWLPDAYIEHGWSESRAGFLLAAINAASLVATLFVAFTERRIGGSRRAYMLAASGMMIAGTALLAAVPAGGLAWAALTGLAIGTLFPLMLTLPLDVADDPAQVGAVAGLMLGVGYTLAAVTPFALGAVRDLTGSFSASLWILVAISATLIVAVTPCTPARLRAGVRE
jgi:MFS transporter, CP family, cyanate transporter